MINPEILENLARRRENIETRFNAGLGKSEREIRQLIEAIDHPASYYGDLTTSEKETVCTEWTALAARLGVRLAKKGAGRPRSSQNIAPAVTEFFGDTSGLPRRPFATNDYEQGQRRCGWETAAGMRSIQINPPGMTHWLIFDCDHADNERWRSAGLPEPTFTTINPRNGHHHVVYRLAAPVCVSDKARAAPIRYLSAIREAMRRALGGDPSYSGLLTKNPLHGEWSVVRPQAMPLYTLAELAKGLKLGEPSNECRPRDEACPSLSDVDIGSRNRSLFDTLRLWAYSQANSEAEIDDYAHACNSRLRTPLDHREVVGIARSVSRYCRRNRHGARKTSPTFSARQSARGKKGGRPKTTGASRPWDDSNTSRSTWYRRQRKARQSVETPSS